MSIKTSAKVASSQGGPVIDLTESPPVSPNSRRTKLYEYICSRRDIINKARKEVEESFTQIRGLERLLQVTDSTEEAMEDFVQATNDCSRCAGKIVVDEEDDSSSSSSSSSSSYEFENESTISSPRSVNFINEVS